MVKEFLEELTNLTKKYGIVIEGCGCCGSPFLYKEEGIQDSEHYTTDEGCLENGGVLEGLILEKQGCRL